MARINKARYWTGVLWLENLDENWQDDIADFSTGSICLLRSR